MHILGVNGGTVSIYFIKRKNIEHTHICVRRSIEIHQNLVEHRAHRISESLAAALVVLILTCLWKLIYLSFNTTGSAQKNSE